MEPQPLKYLSFEDRRVKVSQHGDELLILSRKPTKGLTLKGRKGVLVSDSAMILLQGMSRLKMLSWTYLGQHY